MYVAYSANIPITGWCTTPAGIKIPETERRPGHLEGLDCKF